MSARLPGSSDPVMSPMCSARAHNRSHGKGLACGQHCRIVVGGLCEQRGEACFLEHVQVVVGGGSVRANAHIEAGLQHFCHWRDAGCQLQIAGGVVRDANAMIVQRADLSRIYVHAMRRENFCFEHVLLFGPWHHGHIVLCPAVSYLAGRLSNVNVQGHIKFAGQRAAGLQHFGRAGVRCVRPNRGHNQGVAFPALDKRARECQSVLPAGAVWSWELHDGL